MKWLLGIIGALVLSGPAFAADAGFNDYSASTVYAGPHADVHFQTKEGYTFRSRFRAASRDNANYAGHYVIAEWGCGTGCAHGGIVDLVTGTVYFLPMMTGRPEDYENGADLNYEYHVDSRLLVATGRLNDDGPFGKFYFVMDPEGLHQIQPLTPGSAAIAPDHAPAVATQPNAEPAILDTAGTVYAAFLCTSYPTRSDLDGCTRYSVVNYRDRQACHGFLDQSRANPISGKIEGDGTMDSGLRWHREFKCMAHSPEWTDAN